MTIQRIVIENVKGISRLENDSQILPNRPSLMVAPNGFGKSSITTAFNSLIPSRLELDKDHHHKGDLTLKPTLSVDVSDGAGHVTLIANETTNSISPVLEVFVINSGLIAKATKRNMGAFTSVSATLEINDVVLIDKIPAKTPFAYSVTDARAKFGANGKILLNIERLLANGLLTDNLLEHVDVLTKYAGVRIQGKVAESLERINAQAGATSAVLDWSEANEQAHLDGIECLAIAADFIQQAADGPKRRIEALLAAYQICELVVTDKAGFKQSCLYNSYVTDKEAITELLRSFDTTWVNIRPKEKKGKLIVEFPKAFHISNGQRDSLCFAALMQKARRRFQGNKDCLLIIDEVFDYLDEANLTAVQYYVANLIEEIKESGRKIYPLIFTHLNPEYFRNYTFSNQRVYFLDKKPVTINEHFKRLIVNREDPSIKAAVERYHLHYHPQVVDVRAQFQALGLKETWGRSDTFYQHLNAEWIKYRNNGNDYDPFAVCCFVRVEIEKRVLQKITDPIQQQEFLDTHGTKAKLNYAVGIGIKVAEVSYLLGVIYNEGMHFRNNADNTTPIVSKLNNFVIRKMINSVVG